MFKTIFKIAIGVAVAAAVAERVVDAYKEVIEEKDENDTIFDVIKNVAMKGAHNMNMEARDTVTWAKSEIRDSHEHIKNNIKEFENEHPIEVGVINIGVGISLAFALIYKGVNLIRSHNNFNYDEIVNREFVEDYNDCE